MKIILCILICITFLVGCTSTDQKNEKYKTDKSIAVPDSAVTDSTPAGYKSIHQEQLEAHKNSKDNIK